MIMMIMMMRVMMMMVTMALNILKSIVTFVITVDTALMIVKSMYISDLFSPNLSSDINSVAFLLPSKTLNNDNYYTNMNIIGTQ